MHPSYRFRYLLALLVLFGSAAARAEVFGGINFPQGAISFADEVVSFDPLFAGGPRGTHPNLQDPATAVGVPDWDVGALTGAVNIGHGGRIVLGFTDNVLTGSGDDTPDLHIFEIGADVEATFVEISKDGVTWHSVGAVGGATSSIDIDFYGFGPQDQFRYVRITDDRQQGNDDPEAIGAEIDAVGAISTVAAPPPPNTVRVSDAMMVTQFEILTRQGTTVATTAKGAVFSAELAPGEYVYRSWPSRRELAFQVTSAGFIAYDPALEGCFTGAGTRSLIVNGRTTYFRAAGTLSAQGIRVIDSQFGAAVTPVVAKDIAGTLVDIPGAFAILMVPGYQANGYGVAYDGTITYDPAYEGSFTGAGTNTIVANGRTLYLEAAALISLSKFTLIDPQSGDFMAGFADKGQTLTVNVLPSTWCYYSWPSRNANCFYVSREGAISYASDYEGSFEVRGGNTLVAHGRPFEFELGPTISATRFRLTNGQYGNEVSGTFDKGVVGTWRDLPGNYWLESMPSRNLNYFYLQANGTLYYDPAYEGSFELPSEHERTRLVAHGRPITVCARSLSTRRFNIRGNSVAYGVVTPSFERAQLGTFRDLPGWYHFEAESWTPSDTPFYINPDGTLWYYDQHQQLFTGKTTPLLEARGFRVMLTVGGTAAGTMAVLGATDNLPGGATHTVTLMPGSYLVLQYGTSANLIIDSAGGVSYGWNAIGLTASVGVNDTPASCAPARQFDVESVDNYGGQYVYGTQNARGTSNGVQWSICQAGIYPCCGASIDGTSEYFNTSDFAPPVPGADALHMGGTDVTIKFEKPIKSIVFYMRENGGDASFDFGRTPTVISGASGLTIVGRRIYPSTSGGAVRFDDVNASSMTLVHGSNDGLSIAWYVESLMPDAQSTPPTDLVCDRCATVTCAPPNACQAPGVCEAATGQCVYAFSDTAPPTLSMAQAPSAVECGSSFADPGATAYDACAGVVPVVSTGTVDTAVVGAYGIDYVAQDAAGNTSTAGRMVEVRDTTPPSIVCPANQTVECEGALTAVATPAASATDTCDGASTVAGQTGEYPLGDSRVRYTTTDAVGNAAQACFVTVSVVDTEQPVLTCASLIEVQCAPASGILASSVRLPEPTTSDRCDPAPRVEQLDAPAVYEVGDTQVRFRATDASGNEALCGITVRVSAAPATEITRKQVRLWPPNHKYTTFDLSSCIASVKDACGTATPAEVAAGARIFKYGCDEPQSVIGSGATSGDLVVLSDRTFKVRAERSGTRDGRVCTVEYLYANAAGVETVGQCKVGIPHDQGGRATPIDSGYAAGWSLSR